MNNWKKTFFTIWSGQAISILTSAILQYAIIWYLTQRTNSAIVLSGAMIVAFLPQGVLGLFIGVFIDRLNRKTIMIVSDLCIALASVALAIAAIYGELPIWFIFTVLGVRSVGTAFHAPSLSAVTPLFVPEDMLGKCAGYTQTLQSVSFILSPALGAVLYGVIPLYAIIFLDVIGAIIGAITLGMVKIPKLKKNTAKLQVFKEIKEGFVAVKAHKEIFAFLTVGSLYMLLLMPVSALFPLMTLSYFGGTTMQAGIVETVYAAGMLGGGIILSIWGGFKNKMTTISISIFIMGIAVIFSGKLSNEMYLGFVILSGIMGLSVPFYSGVQTAVIQEKIKPEYLGRVFSLFASVLTLVTPIGLALSGIFGDTIGVSNWFFVSGFLILIPAVIMAVITKSNIGVTNDK